MGFEFRTNGVLFNQQRFKVRRLYFLAAPHWQDVTQGPFNVGNPNAYTTQTVPKIVQLPQPSVVLASVLLPTPPYLVPWRGYCRGHLFHEMEHLSTIFSITPSEDRHNWVMKCSLCTWGQILHFDASQKAGGILQCAHVAAEWQKIEIKSRFAQALSALALLESP